MPNGVRMHAWATAGAELWVENDQRTRLRSSCLGGKETWSGRGGRRGAERSYGAQVLASQIDCVDRIEYAIDRSQVWCEEGWR